MGLRNLGFHRVRVDPGDEATEFHFHHREEEFITILAGRGVAKIGDEQANVGAGDFLGFTAPSLPHTLCNPFGEPLLYLMGGERRDFEVTDYPRAGKRPVRFAGRRQRVDIAAEDTAAEDAAAEDTAAENLAGEDPPR